MNANRSTLRVRAIAYSFVFLAVFLTACQGGAQPPAATAGPVEMAQTQAAALIEGAQATAAVRSAESTAQVILGDAQATAGALTGATPMPGPAATSAPGATPMAGTPGIPLPAGTLVTALQWTPWDLNNLVIPGATVVRPDRPFEGQIPMPVLSSTVYQLKTDLDDTDPAGTWKPGSLVYEYDVPPGWQPQYLGAQGDTSVQLCWQREEKDGVSSTLETQVLLKTQNGNGASALVSFLPVSSANVPPVGQRCAASN